MRTVLSFMAVVFLMASPAKADETSPVPQSQVEAMIEALELLGYTEGTDDAVPLSDVTIQLTGKQWAWSVRYQDGLGEPFDLPKGEAFVVPVGKIVQLNVTSVDIIHELFVPAFGITLDGVPGRLSASWFKAMRIGTYHSACSPPCDDGAGDMQVAIEVVSDEDYAAWLARVDR